MYPWIVQWTDEIPTNAPYGDDCTFSEDFDAIRLEVDKATSIHAEAPTDWSEVLERCSVMLAETSKDLWLFWYGCRAAFEVHGTTGLMAALETCAQYVEKHWQGLFPPPTKTARRAAPFAWFITHMEPLLHHEFLNTVPENECQSLRASFEAIQTLIDKELGELAPSFRGFIRALPEPAPEQPPSPHQSGSSRVPPGPGASPSLVTPPSSSSSASSLNSPSSPNSPSSASSPNSSSSPSSPNSSNSASSASSPNSPNSTSSPDSPVAQNAPTPREKKSSSSAKGQQSTSKGRKRTTAKKQANSEDSGEQAPNALPTQNQKTARNSPAGAPLDDMAAAPTELRTDLAEQNAGYQGTAQNKATGSRGFAAASANLPETSPTSNHGESTVKGDEATAFHQEKTRVMETPATMPLFPQPVPTMSEASLTQLIRNTAEQTRQLAGYFLALNPMDWKAYALHRAVLWGSIIQLPDATGEGLTQIRPPSKERLQEYTSAIMNKQYAGILQALEKTAAHAPFWLDGHSMVIKCLNALRAPMAAQVLTACLRCFIDTFPQLLGYQFFDGTPFASHETHQWLKSLDEPPKAEVPSFMAMPLETDPTPSKEREKMAEALDRVKEKGFHEGFRCFDSLPLSKSRQGLLNALTKIHFCLMAGKPEAALTLATVTYKQLESWGMVEWEPELSARLLGLIIKSPELSAEKRNELYQKLHWIHMETALGLIPE